MKILFVQPSAGFLMRGTTYPVCRSIMVTASYMQSLGNEVLVFDRCVDFRNTEKVVKDFNPEAAMFYLPPTASVKDAIYVTGLAKECGAVTAWGEMVAAAFSHEIVEGGYADFVITGETETKLRRLLEEYNSTKNYASVAGLTYLENGKAVSTANVNDAQLDTLPEIDWDLIDVRKCFRQFPHCKRMLYMYTSRGCPFKCTYCYNTMFYNSQHRKRPLRYVLKEIKYLEEKYGLDGVNFSDELLILTDDEIEEIRDFRAKNNLRFFWGAETRADTYRDIEKLRKMYEAGCRWLMLGIETGSPAIRERIQKPMDYDLIRRFVDMCTEVGITTFGSFIIGFPDETPEQLRETVSFAQSLNVDAFLFNYYIVIPKTPMGNEVIADKKIDTHAAFLQSRSSRQLQILSQNYSLIPDKELLVVKSCFDWITFTRKKKESNQNNMFMKKAIDVLAHFAEGGIRNAFINVFDAGKTFVTVLYYSHAFPKIKKKYGIINVNKK